MDNDSKMRDNITDDSEQQADRGTPTMQRSKTERGEIDNDEIDDDAMIDEATRGDIGAGE